MFVTDGVISILDIYATEEIAGDDMEGRCCAVGVAFSMISDSADEALAFYLYVDRRGHEEFDAAEKSVDVDLLVLSNHGLTQV